MDGTWLIVAAGGFAGGFISGLSGFGMGLAAMPFWLLAIHPVIAAQLAALTAVISQAQTLGTVWHTLTFRHVGPITIAGLAGVPIGVWLLTSLPVALFKLGVGWMLIIFCLFTLSVPATWRISRRNRPSELIAGFIGGFMGGLTGVPGPPVIMWGTVQDWPRHAKRAIYQVFILTTLLAMLIASAIAGLMSYEFWLASLVAVPATIAGAYCGVKTYAMIDDRRFDHVVLAILLVSGIGLVLSS